jgi:hypothetical protein
MNCGKANNSGLVNHLYSPGLMPTINSDDYWYLSSLRNEKIASFTESTIVNRRDNFTANHFSFQQQNNQPQDDVSNTKESPFHLQEKSLLNNAEAAETAIQIIAAKASFINPPFCRYLKERNTDKKSAEKYCHEVLSKTNENEKKLVALGFRNSADGDELRDHLFQLGSAQKCVTFIINNNIKSDWNSRAKKVKNILPILRSDRAKIVDENLASKTIIQPHIFYSFQQVKQAKVIAVFEGFFNSLNWKTIPHGKQQQLTSFLLLNPLVFFQTSRLLMKKHEHVFLYLNHDNAGRSYVEQLQKKPIKYEGKSGLYKGYKDSNAWLVHWVKLQKLETLKRSKGMRFLKIFLGASYVLVIPKRWLPSWRTCGIQEESSC